MNDDTASAQALIMVVDDQPEVLEVLRLVLEEDGYQVITALNGRHALDRLEAALRHKRQMGEARQKYVPDLILSDVSMPVMDGYDFYEKTRANPHLNHVPFIFLTALQQEEDIWRGKELGVDDYLLKPLQPADLLATVRGKLRRVSQRRALVTQSVGELDKLPAAGVILVIGLIGFIILVTVIVTVMIVR